MKTKQKLEFFIGAADHAKFVTLCKTNGYTVAEILRRAVEEKIKELEEKIEKK